MFPETQNRPTCAPKAGVVAAITPAIGLDLGLPLLGELQAPLREAPAMPEVAIDKNGDARPSEYEVGSARQIRRLGLEATALGTKQLGKLQLGPCVTPLNARHDAAAVFEAHDVAAVQPLGRMDTARDRLQGGNLLWQRRLFASGHCTLSNQLFVNPGVYRMPRRSSSKGLKRPVERTFSGGPAQLPADVWIATLNTGILPGGNVSMDPQVLSMADMIRSRLPASSGLPQASQLARGVFEAAIGDGKLPPDLSAKFDQAIEIVRKELEREIVVIHRHSLVKKARPDWYKGPRETDLHWPALAGYFKNAKRWDEDTIGSVDETSTEIVSLLEDPSKSAFSYRGLVVGYVQSGKTANMTAVISKAVDAGYNLVVVFAGLTNKLRRQTQVRLEKDIVDRHRHNWNLLTRPDDTGDFRMPANRQFLAPRPRFAEIAVLKKNTSPLNQFLKTLKKTPSNVLSGLRVLVIDDECDQASVNGSGDEYNLTVINEKIRLILATLPCVSYVGYTATPFANVFINPYPPNADRLDDLYPKDFITALPKPRDYFGTETLFGRAGLDGDSQTDEADGYDMVRDILAEEEAVLQPARRDQKGSFQPSMPKSLEDAILYYLASCAARRVRGHATQHMSMLVHTSAYVIMHERVAGMIEDWLDQNRTSLLSHGSGLQTRMRKLWVEEADKVPADITRAAKVTFEELTPQLKAVLEVIQVPVENGESDDRIDYENEPRTYIVVGGSVLARGLTIEGLMVSYFLRSSSQYDTLLQMGRWFGYRPDYEDLPRIWMTEDLFLAFRALATVEAEIRTDIAEYKERNVTPMEFAVRVRAIPGMAITAANKMRAARVCDISFAGKHVQTIRFDHKNNDVIQRNWRAGGKLLTSLRESGHERTNNKRRYYLDVPAAQVLAFLRDYAVHATHKDLSDAYLRQYITQHIEALAVWNVGLWEPLRSGERAASLGTFGTVGLNSRSKLIGHTNVADIKALMSRPDVLIDCPGEEAGTRSWEELKQAREAVLGPRPLLLLYPIDANSSPAPTRPGKSPVRQGLNAADHLLGFGLVFPGSLATSGRFMSVVLDPLSADEIEMEDIPS